MDGFNDRITVPLEFNSLRHDLLSPHNENSHGVMTVASTTTSTYGAGGDGAGGAGGGGVRRISYRGTKDYHVVLEMTKSIEERCNYLGTCLMNLNVIRDDHLGFVDFFPKLLGTVFGLSYNHGCCWFREAALSPYERDRNALFTLLASTGHLFRIILALVRHGRSLCFHFPVAWLPNTMLAFLDRRRVFKGNSDWLPPTAMGVELIYVDALELYCLCFAYYSLHSGLAPRPPAKCDGHVLYIDLVYSYLELFMPIVPLPDSMMSWETTSTAANNNRSDSASSSPSSSSSFFKYKPTNLISNRRGNRTSTSDVHQSSPLADDISPASVAMRHSGMFLGSMIEFWLAIDVSNADAMLLGSPRQPGFAPSLLSMEAATALVKHFFEFLSSLNIATSVLVDGTTPLQPSLPPFNAATVEQHSHSSLSNFGDDKPTLSPEGLSRLLAILLRVRITSYLLYVLSRYHQPSLITVKNLWMAYAQPWVYDDPTTSNHSPSCKSSGSIRVSAWEGFIRTNAPVYTSVLLAFLKCASSLNFESIAETKLLDSVCVFIGDPILPVILSADMHAQSERRHGSSHQRRTSDAEGVSVLRSTTAQSLVQCLVMRVHDAEIALRREAEEVEAEFASGSHERDVRTIVNSRGDGFVNSMLRRIYMQLFAPASTRRMDTEERHEQKERFKHLDMIAHIEDLLTRIADIPRPYVHADRPSADSTVAGSHRRRRSFSSPISACPVGKSSSHSFDLGYVAEARARAHVRSGQCVHHLSPDTVPGDEWLTLSDRGRDQVAHGLRACSNIDVPFRGDPDMVPICSYESPSLVRWLYTLSRWLSVRAPGFSFQLRVLASYYTWIMLSATFIAFYSFLLFCAADTFGAWFVGTIQATFVLNAVLFALWIII